MLFGESGLETRGRYEFPENHFSGCGLEKAYKFHKTGVYGIKNQEELSSTGIEIWFLLTTNRTCNLREVT